MLICITGSTGFAGRGVLPVLLEAGHSVRALVRDGSAAKLPDSPRCHAVGGNPLDAPDLDRALEGCDATIHMVGTRRSQVRRTGLTYDDVDVASARLMAARMRAAGVGRILLLSAGAIGNSTYVRSKARAEREVIESGLAWTIFRPAFILGPGQQWPRMMEPLLSLMGGLPDPVGDVARRAGNITRRELGLSMAWALAHPEAAGAILDVPEIRRTARLDVGAAHGRAAAAARRGA